MRLILVASVLASVLALGAVAAQAEPAAPPKPAGPVLITPQTHAPRAGDRFTYTVVTDQADTTAGKTAHHGDRQVFDLEVLAVGPKGLNVAYTQTAGDASEGSTPLWKAELHAWNNIRVVYETDIAGKPQHITNLPEAEGAYLAALAGEPGVDPKIVEAFKTGFAKATDQQLAQNDIGNQLTALAGMQLRQPFPSGFHELKADEGVRPDGSKLQVRHSIDVRDLDAGACQATLRRMTWTDNKAVAEPHTNLDATARFSTYDGWVLDMTEVDTFTNAKGDGSRVKTVKFHRDSAASCAH